MVFCSLIVYFFIVYFLWFQGVGVGGDEIFYYQNFKCQQKMIMQYFRSGEDGVCGNNGKELQLWYMVSGLDFKELVGY